MKLSQTGSVLLTSLAVVAICSLILGGAATFVASFNTLAQNNADYQAALQLAEAGVNAELRYVSKYVQTLPALRTGMVAAHTPSNPLTGSIPGVEGTYSVYVYDGATGGAWVPPRDMRICATGKVGNITRTIEITGQKKGIFGDFTFFGIQYATMASSTSRVYGNLGTDGQFSVATGTGQVIGEVLYAGPSASGPVGNNVTYAADPVVWPTTDEIVNATFSGGWNWLTSTNPVRRANGNLRQYAKTNLALTNAGTTSAAWPATGTASTTLRTSDLNKLNPGPDGNKTLIFPPGDYYFDNIQVTGSITLIMDTAGLTLPTPTPGPVRIWMNSSGGSDSQDTINCNILWTTQTGKNYQAYANFRLYYNKKAEISVAGTSTMNGGYYGVRSDNLASIQVTGGSLLRGSVIGNTAKLAGGSSVEYPTDGLMSNDADYYLWYGFGDAWQEKKIGTGKKVFTDGTDF